MKKALSTLLVFTMLMLSALSLFACNSPDNEGANGEDLSKIDTVTVPPRFDFRVEDLTPFVEMNADWRDATISIEKIPEVTDETVKTTLTDQLKTYYPAISDTAATVKKGDTLYLYYMGITKEALAKAVSEGKIADANCTGMNYFDIQALGINFEGGTTSSLLGLKVGSANYIDGFEDGLIGALPSAYGEENPLRLDLKFPDKYGNAQLAGKEVIFFCRLFYIGDTSKPALTADTVSADELNAVLGFRGEAAYPTVAACLEKIKADLIKEREEKLFSAKAAAFNKKLVELATFKASPEAALEYYALNWLSGAMEEMKNLYKENDYAYQYYFGDTTPNLKTLITTYGYSEDKYLEEMKEDSLSVVRRQLVFWAVVRAEGMTLSDEEIAERRADYIEKYGESIFDGIEEHMIYEQFLFDKFAETAVALLESKNAITYTEPKSE